MSKRLDSALVFSLIALIVALQGFAFARSMHRATGGRWILPLDDAYIHQQYARQAAAGYPFRYNSEDAPTSGATSLLYPFLLAIPWLLGARGDGLSAFAFLLGAACLLWSTIVGMRIARRIYADQFVEQRPVPLWQSLLAALLLLSNGALL